MKLLMYIGWFHFCALLVLCHLMRMYSFPTLRQIIQAKIFCHHCFYIALEFIEPILTDSRITFANYLMIKSCFRGTMFS